MYENRCARCNRKLKDPNALYGWRCAEILGVSENLNIAGDESFIRFLISIDLAEKYIDENDLLLSNYDLIKFYNNMAIIALAYDINDTDLWKEALIDELGRLNKTNLRNSILLSVGNKSLQNYIIDRDDFDFKNGNFTTDKYLNNFYDPLIKNSQKEIYQAGYTDKYGKNIE